MSNPLLHDQEAQNPPYDQRQIWKMRWFFFAFLVGWAIMTALVSVLLFYMTINFISTKTGSLPLITTVLSPIGLAPAFWALTRRLARYLFPMRKWEYEIAKEKLAKQRENTKEIFGGLQIDNEIMKHLSHPNKKNRILEYDEDSD